MPKNRIAELRRDHDMNQRELGEKLGVAQTTISAWERGQNEPDNSALYKMSQMFYASIEYIMGYGEDDFKRGLTIEQYMELQKKWQAEREKKEFEKQMKEIDEDDEIFQGLTKEEVDELIKDGYYADFKKGEKPDTFEGYMASVIIDKKDKKRREQLLRMLEAIADNLD